MIEKCARCGVKGDIVKLYDAIYDSEMSLLCERCAIIENVPIIQKPTSVQLRSAERRGVAVQDRLKDMAGLTERQSRNETFSPRERLSQLNKNPELEVPDERRLDLLDHYSWDLMKNRRRKGLSQRQLAEMLGESEAAIAMLEKGQVPRDAENLIAKLEQFFQIKLRKLTYFDSINEKSSSKKPVLLDGYGNKLDRLPEPAPVIIHRKVEEVEELEEEEEVPEAHEEELVEENIEKPSKGFFSYLKKKLSELRTEDSEESVSEENLEENENVDQEVSKAPVFNPENLPKSRYLRYRAIEKYRAENPQKPIVSSSARTREKVSEIAPAKKEEPKFELKDDEDLELTKIDISKVKIGDLKIAHKSRVEVNRNERIEDQKKYEERQKIIEARKEELRQKKEQDSRDLDRHLGGSELLK